MAVTVPRLSIALTCTFGCAVLVNAQQPRQITLKPADAKLAEEFTSLTSVRELSDGRVLISDGRENRIVVADLSTGQVIQVGRKGGGPGEYQYVTAIRAIAGDSSLMADMLSRRVLLLDGARIVVASPPDNPVMTVTRGLITGADRNGFVLSIAQAEIRSGESSTGAADSTTIIRVARATSRVDSVARLRAAPTRRLVVRDNSGTVTRSAAMRPPLAAGEEAVLFTDGWLGIARLEPYRVDWRAPDGRIVRGAPLPVPVEKLDEREKKAYRDRNSGGGTSSMPADLRQLADAVADEWPATIPPFQPGFLIAASDGRLLIRRTLTADRTTMCYDVVDRAGKLLGQIVLAKGERIVGFGARSVYVVWKDEDDIERLRRHPWPAERPIAP
ncbi:MAG TPA: hypothetical protein VJL28_03900 [Gemmatimonadaceae bacterium]|nr:hypothetical protein [Gemmatimonadaceae bacterium]